MKFPTAALILLSAASLAAGASEENPPVSEKIENRHSRQLRGLFQRQEQQEDDIDLLEPLVKWDEGDVAESANSPIGPHMEDEGYWAVSSVRNGELSVEKTVQDGAIPIDPTLEKNLKPLAATVSNEPPIKKKGEEKESDIMLFEDSVFEGDIIPDTVGIMEAYGSDEVEKLQKEGLLDPNGDEEGSDSSYGMLNLETNRRWSTRVGDIVQVPYSIPGSFSNTQRSVIENAARELGERSGVLEFVPQSSQRNYINVVNGSGCSSFVGRIGGPQSLTLANGCVRKGTVQHEFLHALGFWHEQSRPDRDDFVRINYGNIEPGRESNFDKQQNSNNLASEYDYNSVMHYSATAFSRNGQRTITAPVSIGQRSEADSEDIIQMRLLYQCVSGTRSRNDYDLNPCTSDCKCWKGAEGCNGNDDACQGGLVCSNDQCVQQSGSGGGGGGSGDGGGNGGDGGDGGNGNGSGGGGGSGGAVVYEFSLESAQYPGFCIDLRASNTNNGNQVWLASCSNDGNPSQRWQWDSDTLLLRSTVNTSKCMIPAGSADNGSIMNIWDCNPDFLYAELQFYRDGTLRTAADTSKCVDVTNSDPSRLQVYTCNGSRDKVWFFRQ